MKSEPERLCFPEEDGRIVSMITLNGRVIIATEHRLYEIVKDEIRPIKFTLVEAGA